ncbi:MAG: hypothetical protein SGI88_04920 [Candidatus Hydrogenedentes bacterium]|nr:hypothetical protein [Candidatus Hydrogenedentota bacterium]
MATGGTQIFCPGCKSFSVCKVVPLSSLDKPKARRWYRTDHKDIAWFRRGRTCLKCNHTFLSAEVDEAFIDELVALRDRFIEQQKRTVQSVRRRARWLERNETIPRELAERFIEATAWWLTHASGSAVRAPGHAKRMYKSHHGWTVDFGANMFLVGKAIERCKVAINGALDEISEGRIPLKSDIINSLKTEVSGAVANANGHEYQGYYPIEDEDLIFGAQSIDVSDAAEFMINETCINDFLRNG